MKKNQKKLSQKDYDRMWGEGGPYSQVRLCEETRILDDSVSRIFLVVEAEINPFTFEYIQKHRERFADDEPVLQLLDYAEYRDESGYVVSAGETELRDEEESRLFARERADMTIQTLLRMHTFVINECGLERNHKLGVIKDRTSGECRFIWNRLTGQVEPTGEDEVWDENTLVGSPAGIQNNKIRFFIILAFTKDIIFKKEVAVRLAKTLKKISARFGVEMEDVENFMEYMLLAALLPPDVAPADFIETVINECNILTKKPIFKEDYLVTNVKRPGPEEILSFLHRPFLDKGI